MTSTELSESEKAVLLSILRNPEHGDTERASSIGINLFTFNKIKNRLSREGFIKREFVPNYGLLGFEILVATYGTRMEPYLAEEIKKELGPNVMSKAPTHLVFFLSEPGMGVGFHVVEDFTSMKRGLIWSEKRIFNALNMDRNEMTLVPFSFKDLKVEKMFDLYNLVSNLFALDREIPCLEPSTPGQCASGLSWAEYFEVGAKEPRVELTDVEWSLLLQLVTYPDGTDQFHVEKSGLSRYRFKRIRDRLFDLKAIKPLLIPNPFLIGLEVLIFSHMRFKPSVDAVELWNERRWEMPPNLILTLLDRQDAIGIGLYPNLAEGSKAHNTLMNIMGRMNILEGNPHVQVFSLGNLVSDLGWPLTFGSPLMQMGKWELPADLIRWLEGISSSVQGSEHRNQRSS
ncbi:MAG: hypothetical protein ACMUHM_03410 [Thermoplasmatota archaeon]